jgi:hypothetical protein
MNMYKILAAIAGAAMLSGAGMAQGGGITRSDTAADQITAGSGSSPMPSNATNDSGDSDSYLGGVITLSDTAADQITAGNGYPYGGWGWGGYPLGVAATDSVYKVIELLGSSE